MISISQYLPVKKKINLLRLLFITCYKTLKTTNAPNMTSFLIYMFHLNQWENEKPSYVNSRSRTCTLDVY